MTESSLRKLLERYQLGLATEQEKQLVNDFMQSYQNKGHATILKHDEMELADIGTRILTKTKSEILLRDILANKNRTSSKSLVLVLAMLLLLFTSLSWFVLSSVRNPFESQVSQVMKVTKKGQKSNIVLQDGTTIRLNSESKLIYPEKFEDGKREVFLTGEAFFDVVKNPTKPFIINTGKVKITVMGTSFNISAFERSNVEVTVATGLVKVSTIHKNINEEEDESVIFLSPNQQGIYSIDNNDLLTKEVDVNRYLAWKEGKIIFDFIPFSEATLILERWFDIDISFENPALKNCIIRSEYSNENLLNILESLKFIQGIDYRLVDNNKVVINGQSCKDGS